MDQLSDAAIRRASGAGAAAAPRYRPDIDGLRAIAILSVVLFHAGFTGMAGGFVGVDIFFVISGYLIGGQIHQEVLDNAFRLSSFYARRVRRILPALFFMLALVSLFGWFVLTPLELRELGKEMVPTVFGGSNILFYMGNGYFDPASDLKPLLMTWSLGVEEQFYFIFPFLLMLLMRFRSLSTTGALIVLTLVDFAASVLLTHQNPQAAFYLLPTRFWELSIGACLAMTERRRLEGLRLSPMGAEGCALAAVTLLGIAIFAYRPWMTFPGAFALIPTLGSAMLIASGGSWINRTLLGNRPMVAIGKVSYSWYLWHWPVFYVSRVVTEQTHVAQPVAMTLLSLALGTLSWAVIEGRFRRRVLPTRAILIRYAVAACAVAALGLGLYRSSGFADLHGARIASFTQAARDTQKDVCLARTGYDAPYALDTCVPPLTSKQKARMVVIGDSHGSSISAAFAHIADVNGLGFGQMTKSACTPLWGFSNDFHEATDLAAECLRYQEAAYRHVAEHPEIRIVVIAGRWQEERRLTRDAGQPVSIPLTTGLDATISSVEALGRKVVLVQDVPNFAFDPYARVMTHLLPARAALAGLLGAGHPGEAGVAGKNDILPDPSRRMLTEVARRHPNVLLLDPWQGLCNGAQCRFATDQEIYYFDSQHLTATGARVALPPFRITP